MEYKSFSTIQSRTTDSSTDKLHKKDTIEQTFNKNYIQYTGLIDQIVGIIQFKILIQKQMFFINLKQLSRKDRNKKITGNKYQIQQKNRLNFQIQLEQQINDKSLYFQNNVPHYIQDCLNFTHDEHINNISQNNTQKYNKQKQLQQYSSHFQNQYYFYNNQNINSGQIKNVIKPPLISINQSIRQQVRAKRPIVRTSLYDPPLISDFKKQYEKISNKYIPLNFNILCPNFEQNQEQQLNINPQPQKQGNLNNIVRFNIFNRPSQNRKQIIQQSQYFHYPNNIQINKQQQQFTNNSSRHSFKSNSSRFSLKSSQKVKITLVSPRKQIIPKTQLNTNARKPIQDNFQPHLTNDYLLPLKINSDIKTKYSIPNHINPFQQQSSILSNTSNARLYSIPSSSNNMLFSLQMQKIQNNYQIYNNQINHLQNPPLKLKRPLSVQHFDKPLRFSYNFPTQDQGNALPKLIKRKYAISLCQKQEKKRPVSSNQKILVTLRRNY